ncbi:MAG: hypothetical protein LBV03_02610 [Fusobacteriales bacterium]|jgi:hypothetical protein|nr:hypothetical protein [Fusobacteriales bacterium]
MDMEIKKIGKFIKNEIEEQYGNITNFCNEKEITYMPFVNKLAKIRKGKDFQFGPIKNVTKMLGYKFIIVKDEDTEA